MSRETFIILLLRRSLLYTYLALMICSPAAFTAQRNAIMLSTVGRALVCLALLLSRHVVLCMLHKNKRPYNPEVLTSGQRLRENIADIFRQNQLSGQRTQEVCNDVDRCGIPEFKKLKGAQTKDASRNLTRKFLKKMPMAREVLG